MCTTQVEFNARDRKLGFVIFLKKLIFKILKGALKAQLSNYLFKIQDFYKFKK